jgi:hypothetical protein
MPSFSSHGPSQYSTLLTCFSKHKILEVNIIYWFVDTLELALTQHYISIRCLKEMLGVRLYVVEVLANTK